MSAPMPKATAPTSKVALMSAAAASAPAGRLQAIRVSPRVWMFSGEEVSLILWQCAAPVRLQYLARRPAAGVE